MKERNLAAEANNKVYEWLGATFPRWSALWKCQVMEVGAKEIGLWGMLECRDLETWVRWNIELYNRLALAPHTHQTAADKAVIYE